MKQKFTLAMLFVIAVSAGSAIAQDKTQKKVRIGLGLEAALPSGNFANAYSVGAGATFRAAVALNEKFAVTGTTGVIAFIPKEITGVDLKAQLNIPIKAGLKYMFNGKAYALGESGTTIARVYYPDAAGNLHSVSSNEFTYSIGAGAHLGGFDTSLRYEGYTGSGFIGLRIGFNF